MMTHDEQIRKDLTSIGEYADHRMALSKLQGNCEGLTWAYELCREATSLDNAVKLIAGTITTYATKLQSAIDAAHKRLHEDLKRVCEETTPLSTGAQ